ncbi:hypothetical protein MAPG_11519 [Magnaporthiopsis poae ATCC 64411]|uniref:gamma-glutamylcyclotransferase n=1 Tax=Magnaporthiopsis poae (strain ATCC 64411 / 73-15) TaxID=644358 RepID=A0A0C4EFH1_MAGP6|nr:hypothetical protein MAPG_11519 [Magnaporthiopsis poae ATCC 64411]
MKTLYFAYGSNLSLAQMAVRCPGSKLLGTAVLPGFRWQINQRHYANVVQTAGADMSSSTSADGQQGGVAGLVYELAGPGDEAALDRAEGYHGVLFREAHPLLADRDVAWIVNQGGPAAVLAAAGSVPVEQDPTAASRMDGVLVYLSRFYTEEGSPYEEYIGRLGRGIADSIALGVDRDFFRRCFLPYAPELEKETDAVSRSE